jgi:hypothetical protein
LCSLPLSRLLLCDARVNSALQALLRCQSRPLPHDVKDEQPTWNISMTGEPTGLYEHCELKIRIRS